MTRDETIEILDTVPTIDEQVDALEIAIRSLEAWDKVIDDLKKCIAKGSILVPNAFMNAGIKMTIDIINKHLKEVEDDKG